MFLHITGSMRMIDDDEVGLKVKPEDTRYIKRLQQNETQSTGSVGKLKIWFPTLFHYWELQTREWAGSLKGPVRGWNPYHGAPPTTGLLVVLSPSEHEAPGVWTRDLINLIPIYCHHWDCGLRLVQVRQAWGYLRECGTLFRLSKSRGQRETSWLEAGYTFAPSGDFLLYNVILSIAFHPASSFRFVFFIIDVS